MTSRYGEHEPGVNGDCRRRGQSFGSHLLTAAQLVGIALLVRLAMVSTGMTVVHVPYLDHVVVELHELVRTTAARFR